MATYGKWFKHRSATTARVHATQLKKFCEWIDSTPEQLISEYKQAEDKEEWAKEMGYKVVDFYRYVRSQINPKT